VIIPGFGGFIGNYSPAMINPGVPYFLSSIQIPVSLTSIWKQNDGLLASCISQAEQIPYEHALEQIRRMLEDWNREHWRQAGTYHWKSREDHKRIWWASSSLNRILLSITWPDAFGLTTLVSPAIRRPGMQDKLEKKLSHYGTCSFGKITETDKDTEVGSHDSASGRTCCVPEHYKYKPDPGVSMRITLVSFFPVQLR